MRGRERNTRRPTGMIRLCLEALASQSAGQCTAAVSGAAVDNPRANRTGATQTGASRSGAVRTGAAQSRVAQTEVAETGATQTGAAQTGAAQTGAARTGATRTGAARTGVGQTETPGGKLPEVLEGVSQQLLEGHIVEEVGAEAAGLEDNHRLGHAQAVQHVALHGGRCRGSERDAGGAGQAGPQLAQLEVVWSEVVAPLRDTVSLVHGNSGHTPLPVEGGEDRPEALSRRQLGSDVEEFSMGAGAGEVGRDSLALAR